VVSMEYEEVLESLEAVVFERDWAQFHTEENLAKSISIEAAELLENYQWSSDGNSDEVIDELADVLTYCFLLAKKLGVDPHEIVMEKLRHTASKYPIDKAKGRSTKYDRL
jgi:dCTP diphosphatase